MDGNNARTPQFLGLTFRREEDRNSVRNVFVAATVMAFLQLFLFLWSLVMDHDFSAIQTALLNLIMGLCLPAAGYFGAKQSNKTLMGFFCGMSWCQVLGSLLFAGFMLLAWTVLGKIQPEDLCSSRCLKPVEYVFEAAPNVTEIVEPLPIPGCTVAWRKKWYKMQDKLEKQFDDHHHIHAECVDEVEKLETSYRSIIMVMLIFNLAACALSCFAAFNGNVLYLQLNDEEPMVVQPALDPAQVQLSDNRQQPSNDAME